MKILYYIPFLTILGCNSQTKHADTTGQLSTTHQIDNSKYYTSKDSLVIPFENGDTLKYSKDGFNQIVDNHPELFNDIVKDPAPTYYSKPNQQDFGSEVDQDEYYMLYAYFLKQKNGNIKYKERRVKLISIYSNINSLFQHFQHGGTYFGHQASRIPGYAEYSIYLYKYFENKLSKTYDIGKQKDLYIKSLRQLIEDEIKIDAETIGQEKVERRKELNKIVDGIERAITDIFYLRRAQEFQYGYYQYY